MGIIDEELAKAFLEDPDNYELSSKVDEGTEISDAAAEILSKHEGFLSFEMLQLLSDAAAESLSKHRGEILSLYGLEELSDAAAESLSKLRGCLSLGITEISDAAAESLSQHKGGLYLFALEKLSDAAAESLSKYQGEINHEEPMEWVEAMRASD